MRIRHSHPISPAVAAVALLALLCCGRAASADKPLQDEVPHDLDVEMGRSVRIRLGDAPSTEVVRCAEVLTQKFSPASASVPTTPTTYLTEVTVHWSDPAVGHRSYPMSHGTTTIPIPAGRSRVAQYHLTWISPGRGLEVRVPAAPRRFRAVIAPPRPATVVAGTGTFEGVVFGDKVPVHIHVRDPAGVESAVVHYRSEAGTPFSTAAMALVEGAEADGRWSADLPRPAGLEPTIEYHIAIRDRQGRVTRYGDETVAHRIKLADPTRRVVDDGGR